MNIMFIEISSASMFGSRQVFSGEIFVRLDSSAAFFSRWTGFRSPALTSCSFYFGRYRISVPEMVFFIFLWVGPNPPSGIGSLWVLVVLVLVRWWWWAMLMRLRKVLMMFSNRGWIAWRWFFFSLPMMRSLRNGHPAALKVLLMTDSEHVTFTLLRFLAVDEDDVPLHCWWCLKKSAQPSSPS